MNEVAEEVQVEQPTVSNDRPDWLAEKFNTPEDLANAYTNLESKIGQKEEDIRASINEELEKNFYANRPATAGDYELPEIIDAEQANENELLQWWANEAFENGYSQEQFTKGVEMYAQAIQSNMPDLDAEMEALGDGAQDRVNAVELWSNANFGEEHMDAIRMLGSTAKGIEVLEILMDKLKGSSVNGQAQPVGAINEADLTNMMKDPRYWSPKDRDPNFIEQVNEGFGKLYGNK